jgi:outer membrane protein OmpA-like peptidoglycan-associated protein
MVKYQLTRKGKIVIVTLCTFILFCIYSGIFSDKKDATPYYDYSKPNNDNQQLATTPPPPPPIEVEKEEPWKKLKATVLFKADMSSFGTEYHDTLDIFSEAALQHETVKIQVEGNCATLFPASRKQKSINYNLSMLRAQAIANYLKSKGINAERLVIVANGSDKPLKDNSTPEGRKFNRRVDVFFLNDNK